MILIQANRTFGEAMKTSLFLSRSLPRLAIVTLIALACSTPAFCGEVHDVARDGDMQTVYRLVKYNTESVPSTKNKINTPLHQAVWTGKKDMVESELAKKPDINAGNQDNWTPLHFAVLFDEKDIVELLLANKADIHARTNTGQTPLHLAAHKGLTDVAELLIANKAEVNAKDKIGYTPLRWATILEHKDVAELLRKHGGHE
jgi:ankyrin repeat protein